MESSDCANTAAALPAPSPALPPETSVSPSWPYPLLSKQRNRPHLLTTIPGAAPYERRISAVQKYKAGTWKAGAGRGRLEAKAVALLPPRVTVVMVAVLLPEARPILSDELDAPDPLGALPGIQTWYDEPQRITVPRL